MARAKTQEMYEMELIDKKSNDFSLLGKYLGARIPVLHRHNECGYEWDVAPTNMLKISQKCPRCSGKVKRTDESYRQDLLKWFNGDLEIIDEYISGERESQYLHRHVSCGYEWEVSPKSVWNAIGNDKTICPRCNGGRHKSHEEYVEDLREIHGDSIFVIDMYKSNNKESLLHKCKDCSNEWMARPANVLLGKSCPKCNQSHGEKRVEKYLLSIDVKYETQYKIGECKYKRELPFDFAILDVLGKLTVLIEYDGEQHYKPKERFGGQEYLEKIQLRDKIKTDYCKDNNIKLIRIPYWDFDNIESILERELGLVTATA